MSLKTRYVLGSALTFGLLFLVSVYHMNSRGPLKKTPNTTWKWTQVFKFVPNGIRICTELFPYEKSMPPNLNVKYNAFIRQTKKFQVIEGSSAFHIEEFLTYISLVRAPFVKTVCETGFNAGHSAFAWLAANPRTQVYSFDIGTHPYSLPMAEYLQSQFPGRLNITWGNSVATLPLFHRKYPDVKCDLIIIDGGHTQHICKSDFEVFRKMANPNNILLLDNYPDMRLNWMQTLGDVWEKAKQNGIITEIFNCRFPYNNPQGFSVGRYIVT